MKQMIWLVLVLAPQGAKDRAAELEREVTEARSHLDADRGRLAGLEKLLAEARSHLDADRGRLAGLEKLLAEARQEAIRETVQKARAGDAAALAEALDAILTPLEAVDYSWARAFRGTDGQAVVKLVRERWAGADERRRPKMCWLLGLNGSKEAADHLRSILRSEEDARVTGNALMALRRCARAAEDAELVRRFLGDERPFTRPVGFYPHTPYKIPLPVSTLAKDFLRDLETSGRAVAPVKVVIEPPTLTCLGLEWHVQGDSNLNSAVSVRYRKKDQGDWRGGFPFLRVEPRPHPTYGLDPGNLLAGSLFDLEPDTEYEVELTLSDPDGGRAQETVTARTRAEPRAFEGGRRLHVTPGNGGGSGTEADPFRGLAAADAAARPGDVLLLSAGTYAAQNLRFSKSGEPGRPIVWRGPGADRARIDGGGASAVLSLSGLKHVHLEGLTVANGRIPVEAPGSEALVIRRCKIVEFRGIGLYGGVSKSGPCRGWVVSDNVILGAADWSKGRKDSSYGILASGPGHTICYNRIENNWDGISLASANKGNLEPRAVSVDIYGNDIRQGTDDGVEADYTWHNIRIFRNRLVNTFSTLSFQPIYGGPGYFLYNAMVNTTNKPFKLHVDPSGVIAAHNTCVSTVEAFYGGGFHNAIFRNNLLLGGEGERGGFWMSTQAGRMDLDYTGWNRSHAANFVKLNSVRYADAAEFTEDTGAGVHNVLVDWDVFANLPRPAGPDKLSDPETADVSLRPGSKAVDAGVVMPGINDGFTGAAPDLGCAEVGKPLPRYGPRPE